MLSRLITRREQFVVVFLGAAAIVGAVVLYVVETRESAPTEALVVDSRPEVEKDTTAVESPAEPYREEVIVSLVGAVVRPGVYTLDAGKRVVDLVQSGGGFLRSADSSNINLAGKLIDGTTLIIPRVAVLDGSEEAWQVRGSRTAEAQNLAAYSINGGQGAPADALITGQTAAGGRMDLNRASQAELETLPGIGPKLAGEIIRYRSNTRFATVGDIMNVSGIGAKRYEAIATLVIVQ